MQPLQIDKYALPSKKITRERVLKKDKKLSAAAPLPDLEIASWIGVRIYYSGKISWKMGNKISMASINNQLNY